MKQRNLTMIISALGILLLILDGKTALSGISDGLQLCIQTIIPSLFPFFVFSNLLTSAVSGRTVKFLRPIARLINLPEGAESLLAIGFWGGYPVGAHNVAALYKTGQLSDKQASRMVAICNNAGPAFLFGVLGSIFSSNVTPWLLWIVHIISALLTGFLLRGQAENNTVQPLMRNLSVTDALEQAVKVMALICGWVMVMRMVISFLERWVLWMFPSVIQVFICGILELSNGCLRLAEIESESLRFIIASSLLSFGGLCVTLQTYSVSASIPKKLYFPGKLLNCSISMVISCLVHPLIPSSVPCHIRPMLFAAVIIGLYSIVTLNYYQKYSRNLCLSGV